MSIADQLFKAGVLSEATYRIHQADERLGSSQPMKANKGRSFTACNQLDTCTCMTEFKQVAKEILEADSSQIDAVINKAHRFKNDSDPVAKKFIWFFYELRDRMKKLKQNQREALLKKAFRRRGSTFEIE